MEQVNAEMATRTATEPVRVATRTTPWPGEVTIVGAGYMGRGIGEVLALAGARCTFADISPELAAAALDTLLTEAARHERDKLIPLGSSDRLRLRVRSASSIEEAVGSAEYVVEAVSEDRDLKAKVLRQIESVAGWDTVVATNTSAISITTLSQYLEHPARFLGAHWFNPPQFVPAVELIAGPDTATDVTDAVEGFLTRAGKRPTRVADGAGFVANRLQYALFQEAAAVVAEGIATAEAVDQIVRTSFGFRLPFFGPFAIADMAGLDVYRDTYRVFEESFGDRFVAPQALSELVSLGRLGAKTGSGFVIKDPAEAAAMIKRRDRSYVGLERLIDESGRTGPPTVQGAPGLLEQ
jgi:3-hydroxybutyryl-CoA dehydrogenase